MKMKLLVAAAATVVAGSAMAQSAFQGFYGQIATGYESNSVSTSDASARDVSDRTGATRANFSSSTQTFGDAPIVVGLGYNFSIAPKWLLGVGVDYSILSQTSSAYTSYSPTANDGTPGTVTGQTVKVSNRFNVFVTPGYAIDKEKLVYLKAGYSSVQLQNQGPSGFQPGGSATVFPITPAFSQPTSTLSGYIVGLGYKQMITSGLYGFAEGNYMSYGRANVSAQNGTTAGTSTNYSMSQSLNSYQLLVGVGYKF